MEPIGIGVDIGGTKIEAVAARLHGDGSAAELLRERVPTHRDEGYDAVLARIAAFIVEFAARADLDLEQAPLGIGMPGGVARRTGLIKNSNTTCLNGRPFRADLERALGRRIAFDNDANCFALAETLLGAANDHRDGVVFGVILGTGVGGGVVIRGRTWQGLQGIAGEWGHTSVRVSSPRDNGCYCGRRGCLETYASGPAVERHYADLSGVPRPLADIATRHAVDPHAKVAMESLLDAFGRGLADVIDVLDPTAVVLGGGVSNLDALYIEGRDRVAKYVFNDELETPILRNELGDSAGVLGAFLLGLDAR